MPKYPDLKYTDVDHVSMVQPSLDILTNLIYYDSNYLVFRNNGITCYKIDQSKETIIVDVSGYPIEVTGIKVEIDDLPNDVKKKVSSEVI